MKTTLKSDLLGIHQGSLLITEDGYCLKLLGNLFTDGDLEYLSLKQMATPEFTDDDEFQERLEISQIYQGSTFKVVLIWGDPKKANKLRADIELVANSNQSGKSLTFELDEDENLISLINQKMVEILGLQPTA